MNSKGFTLVELAIVLVIIGVILGGVIKGQELVKNAKVKRLYREYQQVEFAYFSYYDRYNAVAGDEQSTTPANVNGLIESANTATDADDNTYTGTEATIFWYELRKEGFYNDGVDLTTVATAIGVPKNIFGGNMIIGSGYAGFANYNALCFTGLSQKDAHIYDAQFDDGAAETGIIRASANAPTTSDLGADYDTASTTLVSVCERIN